MMRNPCFAVVVFLASSLAPTFAGTPQYSIQVVVKQGDRAGRPIRVSDASITTCEGRPCSVLSGREVLVGDEWLVAGHRVELVPKRANGNDIQLKVDLEESEVVQQADGKLALKRRNIQSVAVVQPGQTLRIPWESPLGWLKNEIEERLWLRPKRKWVELTIFDVKVK